MNLLKWSGKEYLKWKSEPVLGLRPCFPVWSTQAMTLSASLSQLCSLTFFLTGVAGSDCGDWTHHVWAPSLSPGVPSWPLLRAPGLSLSSLHPNHEPTIFHTELQFLINPSVGWRTKQSYLPSVPSDTDVSRRRTSMPHAQFHLLYSYEGFRTLQWNLP